MKAIILTALSASMVLAAININTANKSELMELPGIGEGKANAIIEYRAKTKFKTIDEIKNVSGIGDKIYESIKADCRRLLYFYLPGSFCTGTAEWKRADFKKRNDCRRRILKQRTRCNNRRACRF